MTPEQVKLIETRIFPRIKVNPLSRCWEWTGTLNGGKYGWINVSKKVWGVHRLMYFLYKGPIPEGLLVCHTCDNRRCCNPEHLWLGTKRDNALDMVAKGRAGNQNSVKTHCIRGHELTPEDTYITKKGHRACRPCQRIHSRNHPRQRDRRKVK